MNRSYHATPDSYANKCIIIKRVKTEGLWCRQFKLEVEIWLLVYSISLVVIRWKRQPFLNPSALLTASWSHKTFTMISQTVQELLHWQTNKHTHTCRQTLLKTIPPLLCYSCTSSKSLWSKYVTNLKISDKNFNTQQYEATKHGPGRQHRRPAPLRPPCCPGTPESRLCPRCWLTDHRHRERWAECHRYDEAPSCRECCV